MPRSGEFNAIVAAVALLAGPLDVVVQFHEPFSLDQMDRKELAAKAEDIVRRGQALALAGRT